MRMSHDIIGGSLKILDAPVRTRIRMRTVSILVYPPTFINHHDNLNHKSLRFSSLLIHYALSISTDYFPNTCLFLTNLQWLTWSFSEFLSTSTEHNGHLGKLLVG